MYNRVIEYNADIKQMMIEAGVRACDLALKMGVSEHSLIEWLNVRGMTNAMKDECIKAINKIVSERENVNEEIR